MTKSLFLLFEKISNNYFTVGISLVILLVVSYWRVPFIFFQQDEWMVFALIIDQGLRIVFRGLGDGTILHFIPINHLLNISAFQLFQLNSVYYNFVGLLLHFINAFMVFLIAGKFFEKKSYALLAAILFITSSTAAQLVMWPLVSLNTISLTFTLLVWREIMNSQITKNYIACGIKIAAFSLLALLTLEYSLGLLIFVPLSILLVQEKTKISNLIKLIIPFGFAALIYLSFRIYPMFIKHASAGTDGQNLQILFYKISRMPLKFIGQLIISEQIIIWIAKKEIWFSKVAYFIGAVVCGISIFNVFILRKESRKIRDLLIIITFILSSLFPFLFIPGQGGDFQLFPPRYLYYGIAGSSILIVWLFKLALEKTNKKFSLVLNFMMLLFIIINVIVNNTKAKDLYKEGIIRKEILNAVKQQHPLLPEKVIFFIQSDTAYYGLPSEEKVLPYQSGFGQALLIWYYPIKDFPREFYKDKYLWGITEQGYKEFGARGFGCFWDYKLLKKVVKEHNIPLDGIIAYSWKDKNMVLTDISKKIRQDLKSE